MDRDSFNAEFQRIAGTFKLGDPFEMGRRDRIAGEIFSGQLGRLPVERFRDVVTYMLETRRGRTFPEVVDFIKAHDHVQKLKGSATRSGASCYECGGSGLIPIYIKTRIGVYESSKPCSMCGAPVPETYQPRLEYTEISREEYFKLLEEQRKAAAGPTSQSSA